MSQFLNESYFHSATPEFIPNKAFKTFLHHKDVLNLVGRSPAKKHTRAMCIKSSHIESKHYKII
jgi:hypothetical protein